MKKKSPKQKHMPNEICSGGQVTVKPGQSAFEAQQEQLKNQPAEDDTTATTKAEETSR